MKVHLASGASVLALVIGLGSSAWAQTAPQEGPQTAPPSDQATAVDEIVVTAQKRTERLIDVPLTVTAVSAETLAERNITDTRSLVDAVPALTFTEGGKAANNSFRIRGIGTSLFNFGAESSVSTVIDGVVLGRGAQGFSQLADVERVEVLEGPQGTLFGKNADAGVINVVTARPSNVFSARGEATVAQYDEQHFKASISGPLTDTIAASIGGYSDHVGGNLRSSVVDGLRINTTDSWGGRAKIAWDVTPNFDLMLTGSYYKTDSQCCTTVITQFDNPVQAAALVVPYTASEDNRYVQVYDPAFDNSHQSIVSLEANWSIGNATLTSITAYQDYEFDANPFPLTPDPSPPLYVARTPQVVYPYGATSTTPSITVPGAGLRSKSLTAGGPGGVTQFSQELRLTSPSDGRLTYVGGLYYQTQEVTRGYMVRWATCALPAVITNPATQQVGLPCGTVANAPYTSFTSNTLNAGQTSDQIAAFGQGQYKLTDRLSALLGLRVQRETVSYYVIRPGAAVAGDVTTLSVGQGSGSTADNDVSGKFGLQYHVTPNAQFYATYSRGYKGASYDIELAAAFNQTPVLPETVNAYELGFKGSLLDRRLLLSAAAFHAEYQNLQVQASAIDPLTFTTTNIPTNAGTVTTQGFSVSANARLLEGLTLDASVIYSHASVDATGLPCSYPQQNPTVYGLPAIAVVPLGGQQPTNTCFRLTTSSNGLTGPIQNVSDGRLPGAPDWRGNATIRYERPISSTFEVFVSGTANFQSSQIFDLSQDPFLGADGFTTFDASIGLRRADGLYTLTFFAKNITDQIYYTGVNYSGNNVRPASYVLDYDNQGKAVYIPKSADRYFGVSLAFRY